jgi:hypothetical protein
MVKKFVNTFYSGIDKDTVVTKYSNSNMFSCENMRVISNHELSSGALLSVKGNTYKTGLSGGGFAIKGYCNIRDWIIWFVDTDSGARIYKFKDSGADGYDEDDDMILMYSNANLRFLYPIRAIGRYETEEIQKVYFTDTETFFYHLNIAGEDQIDELEVTIGALDLIADVNFATIGYEILSGGNLKAGRIQYAYQLYNVNGSESCFSPASSLINLTSSDDDASSTLSYFGSKKGENTNKSVRINIDISDASFDNFTRLRLVALTYEDPNTEPEIRTVGEYKIEGVTTFYATDTGQSMGNITLETFRFIQNNLIPKTLETKNNYLFLGNIKEEYFYISDEDYDARAFRFNSNQLALLNDWSTGDVVSGPQILMGTYTSIPSLQNDCFCLYNDLDNDGLYVTDPTKKYCYQADGVTIGGEGKHIKYEFITTKSIVIDDEPQRNLEPGGYIQTGYRYPYQQTKVSNGFENYASYETSAEYTGHQRDEIYSYAIVFYDDKGRQSFAKWVGDIRFPNQTEFPFVTYNSDTEETSAVVLGIKFTLKSVPAGVTSWQMVRCERDDANKTVKAAGVIAHPLSRGRQEGDNWDNKMYCVSTVPTINDQINAHPYVQVERLSYNLDFDGDGGKLNRYDSVLETEEASSLPFNREFIEFSSPEVSFYKKINISGDDFIEVAGYLNELSETAIVDDQSSGDDDKENIIVSDKFRNSGGFTRQVAPIAGTYEYCARAPVDTVKIFSPMVNSSEPGYTFPNSVIYSKMCYNMRANYKHYGLRSTHLMAYVDYPGSETGLQINSPTFYNAADHRVMYGYYRQNRARGIYGGTDYSARTGRAYYKASDIVPITTLTKDVYGGDTYIGYMIDYRSSWDSNLGEDRNSYQVLSILFYPVETTINLSLREDDIQRYINWTAYVESFGSTDEGRPKYQIQERVRDGIALFPQAYPFELGDLYRYNRAYSAMDKSKVFVPEPFDFVETERYDTRIYHSLPKLNGEYIDSWLKYLPNHYIDVESEFGEVERLININARVICLQNTGICVLGVNDRSLVKDNNPGSVTLGVGGILSRYDYVAFSSGIDRHDAAVGSDETLYYVDAERKRIYMLGEGDVPISAVKGINSQLKKFLYTTIVTGYDPDFAEVFFSIDGETIVYGEFQKAFIGTQSFSPTMYVTGGNNFYTVTNEGEEVPLLANALTTVNWDFPDEDFILVSDGSTGGTVYKHNTGPDGGFYGGIGGTDAYVELIINPEGKQTCMFSTLDFKMEVIDANDEEVSTEDTTYPYHPVFETIKQVVFSNSYQTSTVNVVYGTNIKKIAKGWRMQVPLFTDSKVATRGTRYVDTYLRVKIVFDASTVNRLRLHDVTTYYTPVKA